MYIIQTYINFTSADFAKKCYINKFNINSFNEEPHKENALQILDSIDILIINQCMFTIVAFKYIIKIFWIIFFYSHAMNG